ncbi:beta-propeller fold lactonase family protein, partial [Mycolicibacterium sp. S2-37]
TANDVDGDPVQVTVPATANGDFDVADGEVVTVASGGSVSLTYTPSPDYAHELTEPATETFTFTAVDSRGATSTATATVTVDPVNEAPTVSTVVVKNADGTSTITVTANDVDGDPVQVTVPATANGDFDVADGEVVTVASGGSVSLTYTPSPDYAHELTEPATETFTFTAVDSRGATSTATARVTVDPVNRAPELTTTVTTRPDGTSVLTIGATDADGDRVSLNLPDVAGGTWRVNGAVVTGPIDIASGSSVTVSYTPGLAARLAVSAVGADPAPRFETFDIAATDGRLATNVVGLRVAIPRLDNTVVATIPINTGLNVQPVNIVLTADGTRAYVADFGGDTVSEVDTVAGEVIKTVRIDGPQGLLLDADTGYLYVASAARSVTVYDFSGSDVDVVETIELSFSAGLMTLNPVRNELYVAGAAETNDRIVVVDLNTNAEVASIQTGAFPRGVTFTEDGRFAYVVNARGNSVTEIDTATRTSSTFPASGLNAPYRVLLSPDESRLYVTEFGADRVAVLDRATGERISSISVGNGPWGMAMTPDESRLYVANYESNSVSVIDTVTSQVIDVVDVGNAPLGVTVSPDGRHVYVADTIGDTISVISIAPPRANANRSADV